MEIDYKIIMSESVTDSNSSVIEEQEQIGRFLIKR
jgi:hypothetical protein